MEHEGLMLNRKRYQTLTTDLGIAAFRVHSWALVKDERWVWGWDTVELELREGGIFIHDMDAELRVRFHVPMAMPGRIDGILDNFLATKHKAELRIKHPEAEAMAREGWLPTNRIAFDWTEWDLYSRENKSCTKSAPLELLQIKHDGEHVVFCNYREDEES